MGKKVDNNVCDVIKNQLLFISKKESLVDVRMAAAGTSGDNSTHHINDKL